jgi:hypothetical protein
MTIDQTKGKSLGSASQIQIGGSIMTGKSLHPDKQQPLELIPDHVYESRHEFVTNLAYKLWAQRGSPLDSPGVDWFAAEHAVYASFVASGMITPWFAEHRRTDLSPDACKIA